MTTINHKTLSNGNTHMFCPDGLLSARPASPTNAYNPYYYATDTNQLFVYFGSAWVETSLNSYIGTCSTAAATADKTLAISGFSLTAGAKLRITFTNGNTADTPTLNINSLGAKAIYDMYGVAVSATNRFYVPAGATIEFHYDGTNWVWHTIAKSLLPDYSKISSSSWATGTTYTPTEDCYILVQASYITNGGWEIRLTNSTGIIISGGAVSIAGITKYDNVMTLLTAGTTYYLMITGGASIYKIPIKGV